MTATSTPSKREGAKRPMTFDRLRSQKKPQTKSIRIATDSEAAEALEDATRNLRLAEMIFPDEGDSASLKRAKEEYDAAKEAVFKNSIKFTFRAIGRKRYDALTLEYPPTEEQRKQATDNGDDPNDIQWNAETFPPALVAASIIEPDLSEEDVMLMWESDDFNGPELWSMFACAIAVNTVRGVVDLGKD